MNSARLQGTGVSVGKGMLVRVAGGGALGVVVGGTVDVGVSVGGGGVWLGWLVWVCAGACEVKSAAMVWAACV